MHTLRHRSIVFIFRGLSWAFFVGRTFETNYLKYVILCFVQNRTTFSYSTHVPSVIYSIWLTFSAQQWSSPLHVLAMSNTMRDMTRLPKVCRDVTSLLGLKVSFYCPCTGWCWCVKRHGRTRGQHRRLWIRIREQNDTAAASHFHPRLISRRIRFTRRPSRVLDVNILEIYSSSEIVSTNYFLNIKLICIQFHLQSLSLSTSLSFI